MLARRCIAATRCFSSAHSSSLPPPNYPLKAWIAQSDELRKLVKERGSDGDVDRLLNCEEECRSLTAYVDSLRSERRAIAKNKPDEEQITKGKLLKQQLESAVSDLDQAIARRNEEAAKFPNWKHPDAPRFGEAILSYHGKLPEFDFHVKDHVQLMKELHMVNFVAGSAVTGSKFYYLTHAGAMLELALVSWAMQRATQHGFAPVLGPDLVHNNVLAGCGYRPRHSEASQTYSIAGQDLSLVATAEIPLAGYYMDSILPLDMLPCQMVSFGHCFRTETGHCGIESAGIFRVHQFSKVELFAITTPDQSDAYLQRLLDFQIQLYEELGLHFKVLDMPANDLGAPAYRKFDIECWFPSRATYGEISSASNCTDFQSRRLHIRYRQPVPPNSHTNEYVHTLNATAAAVPRLIIALLETFQRKDGCVVVPPPLRPFMAGLELITPPEKPLF